MTSPSAAAHGGLSPQRGVPRDPAAAPGHDAGCAALLARAARAADDGLLAVDEVPLTAGDPDGPVLMYLTPPGAGQDEARERAREDGPADPLFEALRARRRELAREQSVPPYVIFHDATLREMASLRPRDARALGAISGVGQRKLDAYGAAFLEVIRAAP